jgi:hypothetical protein
VGFLGGGPLGCAARVKRGADGNDYFGAGIGRMLEPSSLRVKAIGTKS